MKHLKNLKNKINNIKIEEKLLDKKLVKKAQLHSFSFVFVIFTPIYMVILNFLIFDVSFYHFLLVSSIFLSVVFFFRSYIYYRLLDLNNLFFPTIWGLVVLMVTVFTLIILNDFSIFG